MHTDHHSINTTLAAPRFAISENVARTMSSIELLELVNEARAEFGEAGVRHNDFAARCRDELEGEHYEIFVVQNLNRTTTEAIGMTADQCKLVAMRESKGVRRRVLARLNELEAQHAKAAPVLPDDYIGALESLLESKKSERAAIAERDRAIATKALIGSKREATAMATASSAVKKASHLANELGRGALQATMIAVEKANGCTYGKQGFRPLKKWCKANDVTAAKVPCPRYGEASAWPAAAWLEVYGVDLAGLFGGVNA